MNVFSNILLGGVFLVLTACNKDDDPIHIAPVFPDRLEEVDTDSEFEYDQADRLTMVTISSQFPGEVVTKTTHEFFYDATGALTRFEASTGFEMKYSYNGGRIVRTDEFINGQFTQYHAFEYDDEGRLATSVSWQEIPEEGGWIPHSKNEYMYDDGGNLIKSLLYSFNTGTDQHEILTTHEFSNYDDKMCADNLFNPLVLNPQIRFRVNNPRKLVVKNRNGITSIIENYEYTYDAMGYPVEKVTTSTFVHNGQTGAYPTKYFYRR